MGLKIHTLLVEDLEDDAALVLRALSKGGFDPEWTRVQTAEDLRAALRSGTWDVVISDYSMPGFNGLEALEIVREMAPEVPFILVSAAVGEETAVEIMRRGAVDYVMKDKLARLAPAAERELREVELRRARARDREERQSLELQLRQAQKMEAIGTLSGGIAHDLNNILMPILGYAELARGQAEGGSKLAKHLDEIIKAGQRARNLVKQILTFTRQSEQLLQPLRIQPMVKESIKLLRAVIPSTVIIEESIENDCGPVMADPTHIHQIMMNLGTNAWHAMGDEGGVIRVGLSVVNLEVLREGGTENETKPGRYVQLEVADTGCGMDPATVERIFDPYFTTKEADKGTGLGLSVVYGIVKRCGGRITVQSDSGKGSTFRIFLPELDPSRAAALAASAPASPAAGSEHVLIVDDEEVICRMERQMLETLGYRVSTFTSSEEALKAFSRAPLSCDLIVTDQTMPGLTGAELATRALGIRPDMPIILCTGYSDQMDEGKAKAIGIREFMNKPINFKEFVGRVRKVLDEEKIFQADVTKPGGRR